MSEDFEKYLAIANHDIQRAIDDRQLRYYVASILYDYDKKVELLQQKENIIKELNDKIEDDKMIIEGNWGCIDNLKKDYNLHKNIMKEIREYTDKLLKKYWSDDNRAIVAEKINKILDKENENEI